MNFHLGGGRKCLEILILQIGHRSSFNVLAFHRAVVSEDRQVTYELQPGVLPRVPEPLSPVGTGKNIETFFPAEFSINLLSAGVVGSPIETHFPSLVVQPPLGCLTSSQPSKEPQDTT